VTGVEILVFAGGCVAGACLVAAALALIYRRDPDGEAIDAAVHDAVQLGTGLLVRRADGRLERVSPFAAQVRVLIDESGQRITEVSG